MRNFAIVFFSCSQPSSLFAYYVIDINCYYACDLEPFLGGFLVAHNLAYSYPQQGSLCKSINLKNSHRLEKPLGIQTLYFFTVIAVLYFCYEYSHLYHLEMAKLYISPIHRWHGKQQHDLKWQQPNLKCHRLRVPSL